MKIIKYVQVHFQTQKNVKIGQKSKPGTNCRSAKSALVKFRPALGKCRSGHALE